MKKILFCLTVAMLVFAGCKKEAQDDVAVELNQNYLERAVGEAKDGAFVVSNLTNIRTAWEKRLSDQHAGVTLASFEIVQGTTVGDSAVGYYMLVARSKDGAIRTASPLVLQGKQFFFEKQQGPESMIYLNITCSGDDCTEGCLPQVRMSNGVKSLICSACAECTKLENEMR